MKWILGLLALALAIGWGMEWQRRVRETALLQEQLGKANTSLEALKRESRRFQRSDPVVNIPKPENRPVSPRLPFPVAQPPAQPGNAMPVFPSAISPTAPREMPAPSGPVTMPVGNAMPVFPSTTNSMTFPAPNPGGAPPAMPGGSSGP